MNNEQDYYGVRVDTEKYAYLCRLNPNKGEYNLYCYCYIKDWLDKHIRSAEKGIRFITPEYKEKFRISDGEKIRITFSDGEVKDRVCRYIDDSHVEVGDDLYHICEFAERMEQSGATFIPLRSDLPEVCYSILPRTRRLIVNLQMTEMQSSASARHRLKQCLQVRCTGGMCLPLIRKAMIKTERFSETQRIEVTHDELSGKHGPHYMVGLPS